MKPGTFTQLHEQLVFAVRFRDCLLNRGKRDELFSYISGIVNNIGHKSLIVNGFSDHVHILYGRNPSVSTSDTVSAIKKSSAWYVNDNHWFPGKFQWQDGYGAFSYSRSQISDVYDYIAGQEEHHKVKLFKVEYCEILRSEHIEFDERYLFHFFDV